MFGDAIGIVGGGPYGSDFGNSGSAALVSSAGIATLIDLPPPDGFNSTKVNDVAMNSSSLSVVVGEYINGDNPFGALVNSSA